MQSRQRGDKAGWQCPHLAHILHDELFRLNVLFGKETPGMNRAPPKTQVLCATLYQNVLMYMMADKLSDDHIRAVKRVNRSPGTVEQRTT